MQISRPDCPQRLRVRIGKTGCGFVEAPFVNEIRFESALAAPCLFNDLKTKYDNTEHGEKCPANEIKQSRPILRHDTVEAE